MAESNDIIRQIQTLLEVVQEQKAQLKEDKASSKMIIEEVPKLLALMAEIQDEKEPKELFTQMFAEAVKLVGLKAKIQNGKVTDKIKTAKGTRDLTPRQMVILEQSFAKIVSCFKHHGAETMDTPIFELRDVLTGKYGEDSKLIYDLADQGGESLSMRYDLTVPFARYLTMNKDSSSITRYRIGKVYRRDNPVMTKGRFREFFQCDFDIAGTYEPMCADVECVRVVTEILDSLDLKDHVIKINHRKILDGIFEVCGVPVSEFRTICSSVDKLDKLHWDKVKLEMVNEKGLSKEKADLIGFYVLQSGKSDLVDKLLADPRISTSKSAVEGLQELKLFFQYAEVFFVDDRVKFDMSLARGLDYYTGLIFEAILPSKPNEEKNESEEGVGSIAGGGRYDNLVALIDPKAKPVPCVGFSFGIERVLAVLEKRQSNDQVRTVETQVYVASGQKGFLVDRMRILAELWNNGFKAEMSYHANWNFLRQMEVCNKRSIPWAVVIGKTELDNGVVRLRHVASREEMEVERANLVQTLQEKIREV